MVRETVWNIFSYRYRGKKNYGRHVSNDMIEENVSIMQNTARRENEPCLYAKPQYKQIENDGDGHDKGERCGGRGGTL